MAKLKRAYSLEKFGIKNICIYLIQWPILGVPFRMMEYETRRETKPFLGVGFLGTS